MSFNTALFLNESCFEKFKSIFKDCPILDNHFVAWAEIEHLGLKELFEYQGVTHFLGLDPHYCEMAVHYFYAKFSLVKKNREIVGFKTYVNGKKISMNLEEFSDLMELPQGGLDIFGCSATRADFGFPEAAIQDTLFLNKATPVSVSSVTHYRLTVRVANRILNSSLINKAGNFDDIHDNVRAILVCIFRKHKIDWLRYILHTIARPNIKSISYASHISNLIHLKDIPLSNWGFVSPSVTPINMSVVNRMLFTGSIETVREILYHDPPPPNMDFTESVIKMFKKAKEQLEEFGKNVDHIPDYKVSTKRKIRKPPPSSSAPSLPPQTVSSPPPPPSSSREDRVLEALSAMDRRHSLFASYVHDGMTQLHDEHVYLAKKMDEQFAYSDASYSLDPNPPPRPLGGLPYFWPPASYYAAFPSAPSQDVPGSSGAGPSGAGTGGDDDTPME